MLRFPPLLFWLALNITTLLSALGCAGGMWQTLPGDERREMEPAGSTTEWAGPVREPDGPPKATGLDPKARQIERDLGLQ